MRGREGNGGKVMRAEMGSAARLKVDYGEGKYGCCSSGREKNERRDAGTVDGHHFAMGT